MRHLKLTYEMRPVRLLFLLSQSGENDELVKLSGPIFKNSVTNNHEKYRENFDGFVSTFL